MEYIYTRERRYFGRPYNFTDKSEIIFSELSNPELKKTLVLENPVTRGTQCSNSMSLSEANTESVTYKNSGIYHTEGGWPKDINIHDPEQTVR